MKASVKSIFIIVITIFIFISCSEEGGGGGGIEELSMDLNGVDWVADDNLAGYIQKSNNRLNIGGKVTATNDVLVGSIAEAPTTGTYVVNPAEGDFFNFTKGGTVPKNYSVNPLYPKSRATITVTAINPGTSLLKYVEGTFSGVLYRSASDSVKITNGEFRFE